MNFIIDCKSDRFRIKIDPFLLYHKTIYYGGNMTNVSYSIPSEIESAKRSNNENAIKRIIKCIDEALSTQKILALTIKAQKDDF